MDVFGGAPRFLAYPRPVVVQSGADAVLKCQIGGDPRPAVLWERNNEKIDLQGRYRVFEDGNVYNLIIPTVAIEDSGQYICKAKNSIGETYAAATLKVEGEAQEIELREENKPRFLIKPLSTRVGRGEDAVFSCKVWGNPRPEVTWEKDGRKLSEIFESTHFSVSYQDGGWFQLKISKTRAPDGGVYTCKARNEFGEALAGAVLLVDAGPGHEDDGNRNGYANGHRKAHQGKHRSSRQLSNQHKDETTTMSTRVKMFAVTEGKHAKFRCFVTGKPKPEIIWRKDGRLILSGRRYLLYEDREGYFTLKVRYCKQKDNGVYVCAASNTAGQTLSAVHLSVKEPLVRFKQPLIDLEVWEQDLAVLECEVPEDSVPITWYLEDRRLQPGAKYGMEEWGTKRRLTIRDIGVDDDGIYLCEMPDGGRSIAEVAVKGPILRKLPRKVDVLEGENAAFCVEVEKEEMDIHWYKDGVELRETHQTILKSFGRTHILVFVNTMPKDSGHVIFLVGTSRTSSQLRVKAAKNCPPSCPVGVHINTERANAALLSWTPAQDSRKNPPSGYVLERQEVGTGSQEWLQCLTTDSATSVEILGDSVPCEADYRFRICSVNKYGKSNNVEFPRAVHLVPVARIQAPLQDALVPEGQDAVFSIELSASVIGSWFLNGTQLQDDERFAMRRSRTHQSLRIQGVRDTENGAEITFIAYGIRDSAALYIQAPLVKFSPMSEMDRNKFVEIGNPIVLYCELSDPVTPVNWYKNGAELQTTDGLHIQSEGTMRRIVIQSAEFSHSGVYCCDAIDDVIRFNVEVEAPSGRFSAIPEAERNKTIYAGSPIILQCELSDQDAQVHWYKDGAKLFPQSGVDIHTDGLVRKLVIPSADFYHTGLYCCKTKGDVVTFSLNIKAPPVKFCPIAEEMKTKQTEATSPVVLQCEVSDPVCWFKDETQLISDSDLEIPSEENTKTLVVQSTELCHSGAYRCTTKDDTMDFQVEIKAMPVMSCTDVDAERTKSFKMGEPLGLEKLGHSEQYNCDDPLPVNVDIQAPAVEMSTPCQTVTEKSVEVDEPTVMWSEASNPNSEVSWDQDGVKLHEDAGQDMLVDGSISQVALHSATQSDAEVHGCTTTDDTVQFQVDAKVPLQKFSTVSEADQTKAVMAGCPIALQCELSDPSRQVTWYKDGTQLQTQGGIDIQSKENLRNLVIPTAKVVDSGVYCCESKDDDIQFTVEVKDQQSSPVTSQVKTTVPLQKFSAVSEADQTKTVMAGCPIALQCELSDPSGQVTWYKDGTQLLPQSGIDFKSKENMRSLVIPSAKVADSGVYRCESKDDDIQFTVEVKVPLQKFSAVSEADQTKTVMVGCPIALQCELSDPSGKVTWYKDGSRLLSRNGIDIQSKETLRSLVIPSAKVADSGMYCCESKDDDIQFTVEVKVPLQKFSAVSEADQTKTVMAGCPIALQCELSDPSGQVTWYKDGSQLLPRSGIDIQSKDNFRSLVIPSAKVADSGMYCCESKDDDIKFTVKVKVPLQKFSAVSEADQTKTVMAGCPIALQCELSDPSGQVKWSKDGSRLQPQSGIDIQSKENLRSLVIPSAKVADSGVYRCESKDDDIQFTVEVKVPLQKFSAVSEADQTKTVMAGCPIALQCELSDPSGQVTWYKDGSRLLPQSGIDIQSKKNLRSLVIPSAKVADSGVYRCESKDDDIQFTVQVKGLQSSPVTSQVKTAGGKTCKVPLQKFSAVSKADQTKAVMAGCPIALQCELSDPSGQVTWYKHGTQLLPQSGINIQSKENLRNLVLSSAKVADSGVFCCESKDDNIQHTVEVKERSLISDLQSLPVTSQVKTAVPLQKFSAVSEADQTKTVMAGCPIALQCELSDTSGQVTWYKDGTQLLPQGGIDIQSKENLRNLVIPSAKVADSGIYRCQSKDDDIQFTVEVKALPTKFSEVKEAERNKTFQEGNAIILSCELAQDSVANVDWYKDGIKLQPQDNLEIQTEGRRRTLVIPSAENTQSGVYHCATANDTVTFKVDVKGRLPQIMPVPQSEKYRMVAVGCPIILQCEVLDPSAQVSWFKNDTELFCKTGLDMKRGGSLRKLIIHSAKMSDMGLYSCKLAEDVVTFHVDIQAAPVKFAAIPDKEKNKLVEAGCPVRMQCEVSEPTAQVQWHKDGEDLCPKSDYELHKEEKSRALVIKAAEVRHAGVYCCDSADDHIEFKVDVAAPPVTFANIPEEELFKSTVEKSRLDLSCQVSQVDGVVKWYKDGAEIHSNNNITMQAEGTQRNLSILSAQLSDSGTYTCRAGDNTIMFKVNIREPPVMIIYPKEDVHLDRHVPEEIILSCELSRSNGIVSWYKDGQKLQDSENIKLKIEGPYRRLKILTSGVEDSGEYVCDTADDSIFFNLGITEPPVRIVSPSQSQMELCQQTSERMVLSCEISRPHAVVRWYRDGLEVEESDNLILEVDGVYRRLIIPETTIKDSAEYVCDTIDESMTFFVNIAEPPVRFVRPRKTLSRLEKVVGETLVLDCEVSRPNAVVFWKKNGEEVEGLATVTIVEDGVLRQLTVHSLTLEDSGIYVCDAKDDVMDFHVKVQELPVRIIGKTEAKTEKQFLVSDDIILVCELSRANASVRWYKNDQPIDDSEQYCSEEQGVFRSLVVLNASLEDSGEYTCDALDDKLVFHITVAEPPARIVGNSGHPEHHILLTGEELILECEVSRPNATVQWLWNGKILKPDTRVKIYSHDVMRKLVLSGLEPSDSGKYVCDATDDKLITIVKVQDVPVKFVNKKANNKIFAYENESTTLCTVVNQDKANVRWLKDGQLLNKDNIHISSEGNTHKLTINPLQLSDSGDYVCDLSTDEMYFSLFVKEMKVKFIRPLENVESLKGSSVTLRCEINKPKGDVLWLKDGQEILPSPRYRIRAQGRERSFTVHELLDEDAGEYACESTDDRTSAVVSVNTPRVVEFIGELHSVTVCEGEDAVFKCMISPEDVKLVWCLNGKQVALNERTVVSSIGLCHMLCIHNCMVSDSGIVTADAEGLVSKGELQVQEQQVMFTKKMAPLTSEENSEATLEVEVSLDSSEVQWMKQGVLIHPGPKYTLKHKGPKHSLTIHKLAKSDQATYSCETLHDRTQAQLTVERRKITIKKGLTDIKTMERETISFEVELSHPSVPSTWWRDGIQLKPSNHFRLSAKGQVHSLTISNLSVEDTATFMFCVDNLRTSVKLVVKEHPVTILRKLEDQKFPAAATLSIECELSRHNVDVKWKKNGSEVKPGKNVRIYSVGRKRFLQITKCHVCDSGVYTCDTGDVTTCCTVEVYERELEILQALEDVSILEDQNAVFVCEISLEDVPGEWYKNREMIQQTSTIKIRQEGTKHFLLMCNVRPEDCGEIRFVARHVHSVAQLKVTEIPVSIVKPLQDKTVPETSRVILDCTVSNPRCSIRWYKGSNVILPSERFEISSEGGYRKLIIQQVAVADEGTYSMQVGEYTCSAKLTVERKTNHE
ncbi:obscurin-like protein 1 [Nerophis lumbriciformis]|uniref:obscurin-like protein 1 n=1 Tax=Nerophis lumbriciformis TaxID=546530 RepID=UPI003BAB845C